MKHLRLAAMAFALGVAVPAQARDQSAPINNAGLTGVERGRYLVKIMGCNDCHTEGFAERNADVAEQKWLTGSKLGFSGPWGTTYASNLRLYFSRLTEDQWVKVGQTVTMRPPMPWFNLQAMNEGDLRSMHQYVRALGPAGHEAPTFLPPGKTARGPVVKYPHPPGSAKGDKQ